MQKRHAPIVAVIGLIAVFAMQTIVAASSGQAAVRVVTIPASIDSTGKTDVSAKMAAFFASVPDKSIVQLKTDGRYRMDQTLVLDSRNGLLINGNGSLFFAISQGDLHRSNVRIQNSSAILVTDLAVKGSDTFAGLSNAAYQPALEHQHGFELLSDTNVGLVDVTATDVWGDFVYLSSMPNGPATVGAFVVDSHFARNGRQAIALTAARNIDIERNTISDVRAATFDFEPAPQDVIDGVIIRNNAIGTGRELFVAANGHGAVDHVTIANNRLSSQALQIWAENATPGRRIGWTVTGNSSPNVYGTPKGAVMRFTGASGVEISGNNQPFQPNRNMVVAAVTDSCNVNVHNDIRPGSVAEARTVGTC